MNRFELLEGSSAKFWEISVEGTSVTTRWGRIGTDGQTKTKDHGSAATAKREHDKLVAEKTKKGYVLAAGPPHREIREAGKTGGSPIAPFEPIGSIVNSAHPATPVVLGDLGVMKGWRGDIDGGQADELVAIESAEAKGRVFLPDLELRAPMVFRRGDDEVWLLASEVHNGDLRDELTQEELTAAVGAPFSEPEPDETVVLAVRSGAIAVAIAYDNFVQAETPSLPAQSPASPVQLGETLIVVPVKPGAYEVALHDCDDGWMRVRVKKVADARLAAFEATLPAPRPAPAAAPKPEKAPESLTEAVLTSEPENVRSLSIQVKWPSLVLRQDDGLVVRLCAAPRSVDEVARLALAGKAGALEHTDVRGVVPDVLAALIELRSLSIEGPVEGVLPASIAACTHLEELHLQQWTDLVHAPAELAALSNLVELELPSSLRTLPGGLPYPKLKKLAIPCDLLAFHRGDLSKLLALESLTVFPSVTFGPEPWESPDRVLARGDLPAEIADLPSLASLDASRVVLDPLPFDSLSALRTLRLWCTRTSTVLDFVKRSPKLERVSLTGTRVSAWEARAVEKLLELPAEARAEQKLPAKRKADKLLTKARRLYVPGWDAIASFAVSLDGCFIVAGERGGHRVCAWDAKSGALIWERALFEGGLVDANVHVAFDAEGKLVAAPSTYEGHFFWLEVAGGAVQDQKQLGHGGVMGAFFPFAILDRAEPKLVAACQLGGMVASGPCAVYRYPDVTGVGQLPGAVGAVSRDGALFTIDRGSDLVVMAAGAIKGRAGIARGGCPHVFTPSGDAVVMIGDGLEASVHDAATGAERERFCWAPDCKDLPPRKRPEKAWPAFDASGERLAVVRRQLGSKIDGTIGVLDWKSKKLSVVLPAHERPLARLDPDFGAQKIHSSRAHEIPMLRWLGDELVVGALVRADDEPRVGTGLTMHAIS